LFELGCATEFFALARPEYDNWYQGEVVSFTDSLVSSAGGIELRVKKIDNLADYNILVIPSWDPINPELSDHIKQLVVDFYQQGGRLLSFCSGSFFIAQCGLLAGKDATTHWRYADRFKQNYPDVRFVNDVLYVYQDRIGCSAGSAAALDFCLEVVRQDFSHQVANQIARRLVIPAHRDGGQSQFVETPMVEHQSLFASTLDWAIENLHRPLSVDEMATKSAMSRRSFDRHFRASLAMSPKEWITRQRLQLAKSLLESTSHTIEQISEQTGFNNAMNMRHYFRQQLLISPSQYRRQFSTRPTNALDSVHLKGS